LAASSSTQLNPLDSLMLNVTIVPYPIHLTNPPSSFPPSYLLFPSQLLYVPLPSPDDRVAILRALTRQTNMVRARESNSVPSHNPSHNPSLIPGQDPDKDGVNLTTLGRDHRTEGFSGADCAALVREAGLAVIREWREAAAAAATAAAAAAAAAAGAGGGADGAGVEASPMAWTNPSIAARHFEAAFLRVRPSVAAADRARYERVERNLREGMGALQALAVAASGSGSGVGAGAGAGAGRR